MKKYLIALAVMAGFTSLVLVAAPAFAATTSTATPPAGHMMGGRAPGVVGTVSAVNGDTLTVTSKGFGQNATASTYSVDATNATVTKNNAASSVSSIATGDMVFVQGTVSGTNVAATKIMDGKFQGFGGHMGMQGGMAHATSTPPIQGNGEPVVAGKITAVSGTSLTITNSSNVTYTIDASNAKIVKGNATGTISSVSIGDSVIVQGTVSGNSVTASSVIDQVAPASTTGTPSHQGFFGSIGSFFGHLFGF